MIVNAECSEPKGFNPHPTRRPDATPGLRRQDHAQGHVSILTRPEGRMRHPRRAPYPSPWPTFQSSPDPKAGCDIEVEDAVGLLDGMVSILTRPEGRMRHSHSPA